MRSILGFFPDARRVAGAAATFIALGLAACGGDDRTVAQKPVLEDIAPCEHADNYVCGTLSVPLDHQRPAASRLELNVAYSQLPTQSRGTVLMLAGGPGQSSLDIFPDFIDELPADLRHAFWWVMIDQRGTGESALNCPAVQEQAGGSDVLPALPEDVAACATLIGDARAHYGTDATVRDLEMLRQALEVERWTLNGTSYGSYVASQYALAFPERVQGLVLDSVVPHVGLDMTLATAFAAVPRVLEEICQERVCSSDPVRDLELTLQRRNDEIAIFNLLLALSAYDTEFPEVPEALAAAARGNDQALNELLERYRWLHEENANELSQGTHLAALCADQISPWGDSLTPFAEREAWKTSFLNSDQAARYAPFSLAVVAGIGTVANCQHWPPVAPSAVVRDGTLPAVPVLLLAGGRDLITPVAEAELQLAHTPSGRLVVVPDAGHDVQDHDDGQANLAEFLCVGPEALPLPPGSSAEGRCSLPD